MSSANNPLPNHLSAPKDMGVSPTHEQRRLGYMGVIGQDAAVALLESEGAYLFRRSQLADHPNVLYLMINVDGIVQTHPYVFISHTDFYSVKRYDQGTPSECFDTNGYDRLGRAVIYGYQDGLTDFLTRLERYWPYSNFEWCRSVNASNQPRCE